MASTSFSRSTRQASSMDFECKPGDEACLVEREKEVLAIYRKFHQANHHKMIPIPVCEIPAELK
jgi:NAD+ synthase